MAFVNSSVLRIKAGRPCAPGRCSRRRVSVRMVETAPEETARECAVAIPAWGREEMLKERGFADMVAKSVVTTIEDAVLHLRRRVERPTDTGKGPRVVILGTGWGAHAMVKVIDNAKFDTVVVSPRNHFIFTPMLASSSVGTVEVRSIVEPIRASNEFIDYYEATAVDVDLDQKVVRCASETLYEPTGQKVPFSLPYDYLVVAVGATVNTFGVPGVFEHCFFLRDINDARRLRRGIIDRFEEANLPETPHEERKRLLQFIVVGGGPSGCEFAAELRDFLKGDLSRYYPKLIGLVEVILLQAGDTILTQFDNALQKNALENFAKTGVQIITNARVVEVTHNKILLKDGRSVPCGLIVWATGNGTRDLVRKLVSKIPAQQTGRGRQLLVDPWLRVVGARDVYSLGDCAAVETGALPATAQVAAQQGAYVARLFNKGYLVQCAVPVREEAGRGAEATAEDMAPAFQFLALGILAYIGRSKALMQLEAGEAKLGLAGFLAFVGWRSVYLTKQVSFRNRVLVLADWMKTRIFGRDISQF